MAAADASEKLALISENLTEILNPEIIEKILAEGRHPKIYWGTLATIITMTKTTIWPRLPIQYKRNEQNTDNDNV